ncbi:GH43 family beta-xylosidase [Streptomyces glaucescens]
MAAADAVLADPATAWEECGTWVSDGPAVLMGSQAPVPSPAGRWKIRATHTKADEENWVGLVQLLPT